MKRTAAVIVNDFGQILPYTCRANKHECEENAVVVFGEATWKWLKAHGAKVVQVEISVIE